MEQMVASEKDLARPAASSPSRSGCLAVLSLD